MKNLETDHNNNLFYGLQDGKLSHISEVKNGLKCNCICPACEKKLVARNGGQKRIHHFAHYESAECKYGVQTSIHLAAKQILEKIQQIKVPSVSIFVNTEIEKSDNHFISHGVFNKLKEEFYIPIDSVILEKKLHKFIPDVVISSKSKRLIVEIAVTHFVGRKKIKDIKDSKISAIEIDLSKIKNDFNLEDLKPLIIDNLENKIWLHNQYVQDNISSIKSDILNDFDPKRLNEIYEREREEAFFKKYYKPVIGITGIDDYVIKRKVDNCPLKKREFNGQFFAIVNENCDNCSYSGGLRDNEQYLICLYGYNRDKRKKNSL